MIKSSAEVYGYIVSYYVCNLMVAVMGVCKAYIQCRLLRIIISLQLVLVPGHDNNVVDNNSLLGQAFFVLGQNRSHFHYCSCFVVV